MALWAVVWDAREAANSVIDNPHQLATRDFYTARVLLARASVRFETTLDAPDADTASKRLEEARMRFDVFVGRWNSSAHEHTLSTLMPFAGFDVMVDGVDQRIKEIDTILAREAPVGERTREVLRVLNATQKQVRRISNKVYQADASRIGTLQGKLKRLMTLGGTLFAVLLASILIFAGAVAVLLHISSRARRSAEIAHHRALQASETKSQFLANMSHELRTPLNAICGFSQLMEMGVCDKDSEKLRSYARDISHSGDHLLGIINTLMDLARIEADRYDVEDETIPLSPLVEEATRFALGARANGARQMVARVPERLILTADRTAILRILTNLLSNAVKYTAVNGKITVLATISETGALRLAVTDDGVGVPKAELPGLMIPYARASNVRRNKQGAGLGLSIARQLAEAHGGDIEVSSTVGRGSTFTLVLPSYRVRLSEKDIKVGKACAA